MARIINPNYKKSWYNKPTGISVSGHIKEYNTYSEMLSDLNPPKFGWVLDATGDPSVASGAAYYKYTYSTREWTKVFEQEMMGGGSGDTGYVGWFATPELLISQYPNGQNGMRAIVGTTDTIWTWDSDTDTWINTSPGSVDITELSNKLDQRVPANFTFTRQDLDQTGTLEIQSTKPPKGILSLTDGTYFAVAPGYIYSNKYKIDLAGLNIVGTWLVVF